MLQFIFGKMKKKGWMKLAEAFIAILIIGGLLTAMMAQRTELKKDLVSTIELQQASLLDRVQINDSLRAEVLELSELPKESGEVGFPSLLNLTLRQINTNLTSCKYKICAIGQDCILTNIPEKKEVYIKSRIISANQEIYNPRNLNLFCWTK